MEFEWSSGLLCQVIKGEGRDLEWLEAGNDGHMGG